MADEVIDIPEEVVPAAVTDTNVQVIPHFGESGIVGLTIRLQPLRNEVIDKVLAVLEEERYDDCDAGPEDICDYDNLKTRIEALRGIPAAGAVSEEELTGE